MDLMEKIVSLSKRRGFVYPGSEIYGGLSNSWDFGPVGVELKKNIKDLWWKTFVHRRDDMVGIDAALIMNPKVWEASGHIANFTDPLVECKNCNNRFRVDHLPFNEKDYELHLKTYLGYLEKTISNYSQEIENYKAINTLMSSNFKNVNDDIKDLLPENQQWLIQLINKQYEISNKMNKVGKLKDVLLEELKKSLEYNGRVTQIFLNENVDCPNCKTRDWLIPKNFNLMLRTALGSTESNESVAYLRPETAQAMFVDYKNVLSTNPKKLPFGIAQQGKAFRNEITTGNFLFRLRELEQMEIEYFIKESQWEETFEHWRQQFWTWFDLVGIDKTKVHEHEIEAVDRAFYSKRTIDFEFDFPFGLKELYGLAYRTNYDLTKHQEASGVDMSYTDLETNEKFIPHVIEPTWGLDRTILAVLLSSYTEEGDRIYMKFPARIAPYKVAVFPLVRNKENITAKAQEVYKALKASDITAVWDDRGNIGKRYYAQDEIGTPWCVTIDYQTLEDDTVTVRDRDTATQERISVAELDTYFTRRLK